VEGQRKIKGVGFNVFAIAALLIILPLATSTISGLSKSQTSDYISINEMVENDDPICLQGGDTFLMSWIDKGQNMTTQYMKVDPTTTVSQYSTMYDEDGSYFGKNFIDACLLNENLRNGERFLEGYDNHYTLKYLENIDYIGYSGKDFTFEVSNHFFKYIPSSEDISKLKFTFINQDETFNCQLEGFYQDISYSSDLTFFAGSQNPISYNGFKFNNNNKYEVDWIPANSLYLNQNQTGQPYGNVCHIQMSLEFELSPFEAIEFNERINGDYENLSAHVRVYDIEAIYNSSTTQGGFAPSMPVPFTGDWTSSVLFEVAYIDTVKTNFFLNGGTLILGVALFVLAISNTAYWDPFTNFFKPKAA